MIRLESFETSDIDKVIEWNKDKTADFLLQWSGPAYNYPLTREQLEKNMKDEAGKENPKLHIYKAVLEETGDMIGTVELRERDKENRTGRVGRFLIGDKKLRGKGIGRLVLHKVLNIGFNELGFEKITLGVFDFNQGAIKCYEAVGFVKCELKENYRKSENGYWNLYEMAVTRDEWYRKKQK